MNLKALLSRLDGWRAFTPARLRENNMQAFVGTCSVVSLALWICAGFGAHAPALAAGFMASVLMLAAAAVCLGLRLRNCIQVVLCLAVGDLAYAAWATGGIYSPFLAWLTVLPVVAFHLLGRQQGLCWAGWVAVFVAGAAYASAHQGLDPSFVLDASFAPLAFVTNWVVPLTLMLGPLFYDQLYKRSVLTSKERTQGGHRKTARGQPYAHECHFGLQRHAVVARTRP